MSAVAVPEQEWLPEMADLAEVLAAGGFPPGPGAWAWLEQASGTTGNVALCAVRDVVWHPASGLAKAGGQVLFSPSNQVRNRARLRRVKVVRHLQRGALWLSPGGLKNYGHFLFDGLTGLAALEGAGLTGRFAPVSAGLKGWQRDLLTDAKLVSNEMSGGAVAIGQAVYATTMNSYLNRAGALVPALAERFGRGGAASGAVYLSRRGYTGRILVNEAALEKALTERSVQVLRPEALPVSGQIEAARKARVLIGASGAALANALFMAPGGSVVELRPDRVTEPWMALTTAALGLHHIVVPLTSVPAPPLAQLRQLPRALTGRYHYCLRADIGAVLAALG